MTDMSRFEKSSYLANVIEEIPTVRILDFVTSTVDPDFCRQAGVTPLVSSTCAPKIPGMECFRPVTFDVRAFEELKRTDGHTASFLMISNPSRHLKHGLPLGFTDLAPLIVGSTERPIRI